jgi:hypothetical protein
LHGWRDRLRVLVDRVEGEAMIELYLAILADMKRAKLKKRCIELIREDRRRANPVRMVKQPYWKPNLDPIPRRSHYIIRSDIP